MKRNSGFNLIELIIFIIAISIIATGILSLFGITLSGAPKIQKNSKAIQSASKCLEWYLGERYMRGFNSISCPSTTVPPFCNIGSYTIKTNVTCTTIDSDSNYKTIDVNVEGEGNAKISLIISDY